MSSKQAHISHSHGENEYSTNIKTYVIQVPSKNQTENNKKKSEMSCAPINTITRRPSKSLK